MKRFAFIAIVLVLVLIPLFASSNVYKVPMKKLYRNNMKIADETGRFYLNPQYINFQDIDETEEQKEIEAEIINQQEMVYYGSLWFFLASPENELDFIFDTGSSWLWASVEGCTG